MKRRSSRSVVPYCCWNNRAIPTWGQVGPDDHPPGSNVGGGLANGAERLLRAYDQHLARPDPMSGHQPKAEPDSLSAIAESIAVAIDVSYSVW